MGRVKKEACLNQQRVVPNVAFFFFEKKFQMLLSSLIQTYHPHYCHSYMNWRRESERYCDDDHHDISIDDKLMMMVPVCVSIYTCLEFVTCTYVDHGVY